MKEGGAIVSLPTPEFSDAANALAADRNINAAFMMVQSNGEDMETLKTLLATGSIKPHVSKVLAFNQMAEVHSELETGRVVGKIVVRV